MRSAESYNTGLDILRDVAEIVRPPRRITVSQAASEVVQIETPGGYAGPWDPDITPYMVEPMDALKSRAFEAVVFSSPARAGKTMGLLDGWLSHCVTADPGDMGLYFSTQGLAYDYRKRRLERLHRHSPRITEKLSKRSHDTTVEMVTYRNGMILTLGWPTSSQLAQRDLRYVALSDYDSFPDDISGEGSPFDLARKRIQVAMSAGMALVESSPKRVQTAAQWRPDGPHEAPPVAGGILPLYNRGDRRRWLWQCVDGCGEWWEAPAIPAYDEGASIADAAASAHVACPTCGQVYRQDAKKRLNDSAGRSWVPEGFGRDRDGNLVQIGEPRRARIASFWVLGCAAAFQTWGSIVANYLQALRHCDSTGDETALAATVNTDQGLPYRPRSLQTIQGMEYLSARREPWIRHTVPEGVRLLIASVDVQGDRFEVAIWGYGEGRERWLIERFALHRSEQGHRLQPAAYLEHWDVVTDRVVNAVYGLGDGRTMRVRRVAVDSGGGAEKGGEIQVTSRAYDWWRKLRTLRLSHRVWLVKGERRRGGKIINLSYPDSRQRTDRKSGAAGDVPVLILRSDALKDAAHIDLQRDVPGPGYVHIPEWLPDDQLAELASEKREPDGWHKVAARNETWDLLCYADAVWHHEGCDTINWSAPPPWADEWAKNIEVLTDGTHRPLIVTPQQPREEKPRWVQQSRTGWLSRR